jgi:hypothetical protein
MMPLVTMSALTKAIQRRLNVAEEEARRYAGIVLDLFGYDDCIIDNILDHHDRRLFYRLQAEGLLDTQRDEVILCDGKSWRIHYWMLQKHAIFHSEPMKQGRSTATKNRGAPSYKSHTVYSSLPDKAWAARKPSSYEYPLS